MNKGDRNGSLKCHGFTIVETMIVLAVTGLLFVLIAITLNGRQNEAEFVHAVHDAQAQIQLVINQTSEGLYPSANNFQCLVSPGSNNIKFKPPDNGQMGQGANTDCILLGRVIQFVPSGTSNNGNQVYNVYTVTGLRSALNGPNTPFQNSGATVVDANFNNNLAETTTPFEYGLTVCWVSILPRSSGNCSSSGSLGAIAFLMEPGGNDPTSANGYSSGAQQVDVIPILNTSLNQSKTSIISKINSTLKSTNLIINPLSGVGICLESGAQNQSGLITIGGSGSSQLLVNLSIKSNGTCQ